MKKIVIILLLFVQLTQSFGNNELVKKANEAFAQKKFQTAQDLYLQVEKSGFASAGLYQNIALTHVNLHQDPQAILYFEKALKHSPQNSKIMEQLFVIQKRNSKIDTANTKFAFGTLIDDFTGRLGLYFWMILSLILLASIGVTTYIQYPNLSKNKKYYFTSSILGILFILSIMAGYLRHQTIYHNDGIIITQDKTLLMIGPDKDSPEVSSLPSGTKVYYLDHVDGWWQVSTGSGDTGWIPSLSGARI